MSGTQYNCVQSNRDAIVWEPTLFSMIPSQNPNIEKGNRLEVATEIALRRCGIEYENLTGWYHRGNIADFETPTLLIECKNWFTDHYRITVEKVRTQILPRFTHADDKRKVLIISECKWDSAALRLVRQNKVNIIEVPRVRTDSDILYVADRIKEALSRVCRIDDNGTNVSDYCINNAPKSLRYRILNRISNAIIRVLGVSEAKTPHNMMLKLLNPCGYTWIEGLYSSIVGLYNLVNAFTTSRGLMCNLTC